MGTLEIICGPMFSGKSEELIRRLQRTLYAKQNTIIFTPSIDTRCEENTITSHNGRNLKAVSIQNSSEMLKYIDKQTQVVGIDEVQFLGGDTVEIIMSIVNQGKRVICAGLDKNFKGEGFGVVPELLALADNVTKLSSICMVCGNEATYTQRLIDDKPASYNDPIILIGASDSYEPRCRKCYVIDKI
ncbi:thymidine kinase [Candidatus Epulonipiscium fishelsonii]|uniref:Thymidine kinase n=2 Tax=Candidatus Epulonipiscium fishelsonii TaxID=77094 RepID=A0ACC8XEZ6_9FIRM|nr:thymidine kinase [Epulopiscium sp. SCG-B11WGA-EpuloA1]ONI41622.1 thymidine kinase [Epulopiscium sp. SCG-B11WGA-EpuloA1]ONI43961.1 thymidine kinase [Epulopiscium sp. SCG-B05WGA-EpuloA1]